MRVVISQQWKSLQVLEDPFLRLLLGWWPLQPFLDSIYIPNLGCLAQKSSTDGSSPRSNHKLPNFQFYSIHFCSSVVFRCSDYRFEQIEPSSLFWVTVTLGFPTGSVVKNPAANAGDTGSIPIRRRRKRQPSLVILPGKSHWRRNLEGYSPQGWRVELKLATNQQIAVFTSCHVLFGQAVWHVGSQFPDKG